MVLIFQTCQLQIFIHDHQNQEVEAITTECQATLYAVIMQCYASTLKVSEHPKITI